MGRFDVLTQLEKKPVNAASPSVKSEPFQPTSLSEKQVASKPANQRTSKEANQQTGLPPNQQGGKPANQQASKSLKKFSSYLTEESLKALKRRAFDAERKDYEMLQEAVDYYLASQK